MRCEASWGQSSVELWNGRLGRSPGEYARPSAVHLPRVLTGEARSDLIGARGRRTRVDWCARGGARSLGTRADLIGSGARADRMLIFVCSGGQ